MELNKLNTFRVENGLGKHIVFSALIPELFAKYGKINIISAYNDVFMNNPMIENSWNIDFFEQNKKELSNQIKYLYYHEPYKGEYSYSNIHILQSWCNAYELNYNNVGLPQIFLNDELKEIVANFKKEIGTKYFLTQFSGGQPALGFNPQMQYELNMLRVQRNYPVQMATILVNKLKKHFPDYKFIDFTLPNEPSVYGTERIQMPYLCYIELIKDAKEVICIDSSLGHLSASCCKKAYILWNTLAEATPQKYGWDIHNNISAPNLTIDYDIIVDMIINKKD
jgi:hypothetical protein